MTLLANVLSILGFFCGFISVIFSLQAHFTFASWAILFSVFFDGVDGQIARRNPVPNEFGKELDSLVDVVSFAIAPALLGYIFIYRQFYLAAVCALFIYLVCSVVRLAKYNITSKEKMLKYFYGLPTTVSGGILASFILIYRSKVGTEVFEFAPAIFLCMLIILSFLMVSRIRYLNLDGIKEFFGASTPLIITVMSSILIIAAMLRKAGIALTVYFLIYLLFCPFVVKFWLKDKD